MSSLDIGDPPQPAASETAPTTTIQLESSQRKDGALLFMFNPSVTTHRMKSAQGTTIADQAASKEQPIVVTSALEIDHSSQLIDTFRCVALRDDALQGECILTPANLSEVFPTSCQRYGFIRS
jgi:hypothetical protein